MEDDYEYVLFNITKDFETEYVPNLIYGFLILLSLFFIPRRCINKGSITEQCKKPEA